MSDAFRSYLPILTLVFVVIAGLVLLVWVLVDSEPSTLLTIRSSSPNSATATERARPRDVIDDMPDDDRLFFEFHERLAGLPSRTGLTIGTTNLGRARSEAEAARASAEAARNQLALILEQSQLASSYATGRGHRLPHPAATPSTSDPQPAQSPPQDDHPTRRNPP